MQEFMTYLTENLSSITLQAALRLIAFCAMLFLGIRLIKWFLRRVFTLERFSRKRNVDPTIFNFLHTVAAIGLYVLLVFTCASILNLPMTGFMTALGSIGLGLGLALQGGLSNLAGSVLIAVFRPFSLGDYIETGDTAGTVKDIGLCRPLTTAGSSSPTGPCPAAPSPTTARCPRGVWTWSFPPPTPPTSIGSTASCCGSPPPIP